MIITIEIEESWMPAEPMTRNHPAVPAEVELVVYEITGCKGKMLDALDMFVRDCLRNKEIVRELSEQIYGREIQWKA